MLHGIFALPLPENEPVREYRPGSPERRELLSALESLSSSEIEIPLVIGGKRVRTGNLASCVMPHEHRTRLATVHVAGEREVELAVRAALEAWEAWSRTPWWERAAIFRRAASLLAGPWRARLNAATMLGQSKSVHQAEIDAACELVDFFNFNTAYLEAIYREQPPVSPRGVWNAIEARPLEGFVFAATPFNFTSIAGNLPTAPALMGNVSVWKPASTAVLSAYSILLLLEEAGLPPGVVNFLPGPGATVGPLLLARPELAGVHFTGSTAVFRSMWRAIGERIDGYRSYPRIVGETGGKDFVVAHASADPDELVAGLIRGAYEYQGQKCSAASRAYIPDVLWDDVRDRMVAELETIRVGDPRDFTCFMNAVIDANAFRSIRGAIEWARSSPSAAIVAGGGSDDRTGYFIEPTLILTADPRSRLMTEEIFGPVLTVFVYPAERWADLLRLVDDTGPYALTGAVFARDRRAITEAREALVHAAGNFYVNDKPTGAVVGQQPFGGGRASGTNDKSGSPLNLLRWVSHRAVKENFLPPKDYRYPFLEK